MPDSTVVEAQSQSRVYYRRCWYRAKNLGGREIIVLPWPVVEGELRVILALKTKNPVVHS